MYKEVPEDLMAKIKEAAGTINKHNCAVDTMLIAVGNIPQRTLKKRKIRSWIHGTNLKAYDISSGHHNGNYRR